MQIYLEEKIKKEELFKLVFSRYGNPGFFPITNFDDKKGLEEIKAILQFCISTHKRGYGEKGEIYFDYIDNRNFNALATTANGYEFISIFSGTIFHLYRLFFSFMSDPKVLPTFGNIDGELISTEVINSIASNTFELQHPKDKARFVAAQNFALVCCLLILTHEIGHIANCHVHLLKNRFSLEVYEEIPMSPSVKNELFHAFEWEADEYSGVCTYLFLQHFGSIIPIVETLGVDYILSVSSLMLFLYMHNLSGSEFHSESTTHPSPFDRWIWLTLSFQTHDRCKPFKPKHEKILRGIDDVLGFWSRHSLLDKTKFDFSESRLLQTKSHYEQVRCALKENLEDLTWLGNDRLKKANMWFENNKRDMWELRSEALDNLKKNLVHPKSTKDNTN